MNKLFDKQLRRAMLASGEVDIDRLGELVSAAYDEAEREQRRTDRSIALMVNELDELHDQLEEKVRRRTHELASVRATLETTLNAIAQGVLMVNGQGFVRVRNQRATQLLGLGEEAIQKARFQDCMLAQSRGSSYQDANQTFLKWLANKDESRPLKGCVYHSPSGAVLQIDASRLTNGGMVLTVLDGTDRFEREEKLQLAESEYRGLYENAQIGIYRASFDGRLLRANPALVALHGYKDEQALLYAVNVNSADWYASATRRAEFIALLEQQGNLNDFVSEMKRACNGERLWVSETAWIVHDRQGRPVCYEGTIVDTSDRMRAETEIAHIAHHDQLTDLPNRIMMLKKLNGALEADGDVMHAVFCLDLDRFKEVNDTLGHQSGDQLLRVIAGRIADAAGNDAMVARLGGDEFTVLSKVESVEHVESMASTIIENLVQPVDLDGHPVTINVSIGIALAPEHGASSDVLLRNADIALYRAKAAGGGLYQIFRQEMAAIISDRRSLELDLRSALANDELELYHQPIFDIDSGYATCHETLMRWKHPTRGFVSPGLFIPIAEDSGLIHAMGEWAVERACQQAVQLPEKSAVAVNFSPVQFRDPLLPSTVEGIIERYGLDPACFEVEITESVVLNDDRTTTEILKSFRAMGLRIALDDFGTGQSSLSLLQRFHFDKIKIDSSFVARIEHDPTSAAVVRAVISLGRDLGASVVAEGVETAEQYRILRSEGCRYYQGYLFARPAPFETYVETATRQTLQEKLAEMKKPTARVAPAPAARVMAG